MRRILCFVLACMSIFSCLFISAGAVEVFESNSVPVETMIMRASGSFNMSVGAYRKTVADTSFPLAAGESVRIRANYAPEDASMDFGLVDSEEVFHYITVTTGSIDATITVPESGNYTLAIRNNSGVTVKVSGIVNY